MDDVGGDRDGEGDQIAGDIAQARRAQGDDGRALLHEIGVLLGVHLHQHIAGVEIAGQRGDDPAADGAVAVLADILFDVFVDGADHHQNGVDQLQQRHQ